MATVPRSERAAARQAAYGQGLALPPASPGSAPGFPVRDAAHWDKARQAVGRVKDPARRDALARLLRKTAPRYGKEKALAGSWAAPGGSQHANNGYGISLAMRARDEQGLMLTCPECGHVAPSSHFGASGASLQKHPDMLRTPARGNVRSRAGFQPGSSGIQPSHRAASHALAGDALALELATAALPLRRHPVSSPLDVLVTRGENGAVIRHRRGGAEIAKVRKNDDGSWTASIGGKDLPPHPHQRAALMEAVGTWNKSLSAARPQAAPLMQPPVQTPLMAEYGIPAMRSAAFATPATGYDDGPRMTTAGGTGGGPDGLTPTERALYKRLCARGMDKKSAMTMAKRAAAMKARAA